MRLVNVETLRLELFYGEPTRPYAILSHTWGKEEDELSFQDMQRLGEQDTARRAKLDGTCAQARKDGFKYVWIDTCCIDKTNAVELSEAITSMFRWYKKSRMCYTLLSDVDEGQTDGISKSRWFSRGWTLQELLASPKMTFFDSSWKVLGTKSSLSGPIMEATHIPHHILTGIASLDSASIAQKFSWASRRTTTRPEDMAYCLFGIFNIVIPPLYGEGLTAAFERLQEAIIKRTHDDSILAWGLADGSHGQSSKDKDLPAVSGGILASSPAAFKGCGDIVRRAQTETRIRVSETSWGTIPISIYLRPGNDIGEPSYGYLSCGPQNDPSKVMAVPLVRSSEEISSSDSPPVFLRPRDSKTICMPKPTANRTIETILVHKDRAQDAGPTDDTSYWLYLPGPYPLNATIEEVYPANRYEEETARIETKLDLGEESSVYLVRFSYMPPSSQGLRVERYLLAVEFYRESAHGQKEPRVSLYFDDPGDQPVPLSRIAEMWPSLSTSRSSGVHCPNRKLSVGAYVSANAISGNHLWTVTFAQLPSSMKESLPDGWPSIPEQISLRLHGIHFLQHLQEGAVLRREYDRLKADFHEIYPKKTELEKRLDRVNDEIRMLQDVAASIEYDLSVNEEACEEHSKSMDNYDSQVAEYKAVQDANASSIEVRRVWFRSAFPAERESTYAGRRWEDAERQERSGIVAHIMRLHPLLSKGKELQWVPGVTLLMYAAATGDRALVETVLTYDDDIDAKDSVDRTVHDWATLSGSEDVMVFLKQYRSSRKPESVDN